MCIEKEYNTMLVRCTTLFFGRKIGRVSDVRHEDQPMVAAATGVGNNNVYRL